jgi:hypothetical protein
MEATLLAVEESLPPGTHNPLACAAVGAARDEVLAAAVAGPDPLVSLAAVAAHMLAETDSEPALEIADGIFDAILEHYGLGCPECRGESTGGGSE